MFELPFRYFMFFSRSVKKPPLLSGGRFGTDIDVVTRKLWSGGDIFQELRATESIREDHIDRIVRDLSGSDRNDVVVSIVEHTATDSLRELSRISVSKILICELEVVGRDFFLVVDLFDRLIEEIIDNTTRLEGGLRSHSLA